MDVTINYSKDNVAQMEIRNFIAEGLKDVQQKKLLDFDTTFDELEKRYSTND